MEVQVKDMHQPRYDRSVLAVCDLVLDQALVVKGVRVQARPQKDGDSLFVAWPARRDPQGNWHEVVVPLTPEARDQVEDLVLAAFTQLLIDRTERLAQAADAKKEMIGQLER